MKWSMLKEKGDQIANYLKEGNKSILVASLMMMEFENLQAHPVGLILQSRILRSRAVRLPRVTKLVTVELSTGI